MADDGILDVDLLAFERGDDRARGAVVDGVRRSLATGFMYTTSDLPPDLLDTAYGMLARFFALAPEQKQRFSVPGASGQTGYTGPLVETAANSAVADWKEMLNWSLPLAPDHPLRRRYPTFYPEQQLPEAVVPGITEVLERFHRAIADLQRRVLRVIALGLGLDGLFFDAIVQYAPTLTRALRYPPMATANPPMLASKMPVFKAFIDYRNAKKLSCVPGRAFWGRSIGFRWCPGWEANPHAFLKQGILSLKTLLSLVPRCVRTACKIDIITVLS